MQRVVRQQRLGYVATICADGTPNLSPKGTLTVWDDDHLIFADIRSPGTVANLQHNPHIDINVIDIFSRKGYRSKGTAQVIVVGPQFESMIGFFAQQGLSDAPHRVGAVVLIEVTPAR